MTIHNNIDNFLAADLHDDLSEEERHDLHTHLVECPTCRQLHQENKIMSKILEETLRVEKSDPAFERRMLSGFRKRAPQNAGSIAKFIVDLMQLRSAQLATVAAILLALVQMGKLITKEPRQATVAARTALDRSELQPDVGQPGETASESAAKSDQLNIKNFAAATPGASAGGTSQAYGGQASQFAPGKIGQTPERAKSEPSASLEKESVNAPSTYAEAVGPPLANRKLIRSAKVEFEVMSFEDSVQRITVMVHEGHGYVATTSSRKQANGKLRGEVMVKVLPDYLDSFLQKIRGLGELKNQTLGTEDVTKAYFDTDARFKNARVMEQRLIDMLKKNTGKVSDLLQVEKELGRVREDIEKMQGELKYWDSQVQFATVTILLAEKDVEEPAAFLLKERTQLALYVNDVEKVYNDVKTLASPKVQITSAQLDRDNAGRVAAHLSMLIVPEESDAVVSRVKGMGRVENFQVQTERVAQGGNGMSENAKTKRDKVALNITISRETDEQPVQETSLRILTSNVDQNAARLKADAVKSGAEIRNSTFSRDPDGREVASIFLRLPMKNYAPMMKSLSQLGAMKDVSVQRHDKIDKNGSEETAPADISIQIYSRGNIVSSDTSLLATLRNTVAQGVGALMWSLRMIGVAIAFLAPWAITLVGVIWITRRIARRRNKT
jgi:Domain of unknown function (DUF4349)